MLTPGTAPLHKVTILPRGNSGGATFMLPRDNALRTRASILAEIDVSMGGRAAEELVYGAEQVTSGASGDMQGASSLARAYCAAFAMSEVGMPAGLRALLTDSIQELESVQEAWPVMQSLLVNALNRPAMTVPVSGVHALCGPSGSGKTSMVGRLAYAAAMVHGTETQVMISFADQRPGAWAQMQLLAAQSGVACFRAANSDMLRALLLELEGKTVWIDTCGTDFSAQAERLQTEHPKVLRHAVLPVDATVTSVQKILQNAALNWSSLMLSKVDEAAYPWALIKGLSEQSLGVSCMAGSTRIEQAPESFDAQRLVQLALTPLLKHLPQVGDVQAEMPVLAAVNVTPSAPVRPSRAKKSAVKTVAEPVKKGYKTVIDDDILIPTLMGAVPMTSTRRKPANAASALKVAHG
jgi:hypothetical protein